MKYEKLQESMIREYETALREGEKSEATVDKYMRHIRQFVDEYAGRRIDKALMLYLIHIYYR